MKTDISTEGPVVKPLIRSGSLMEIRRDAVQQRDGKTNLTKAQTASETIKDTK